MEWQTGASPGGCHATQGSTGLLGSPSPSGPWGAPATARSRPRSRAGRTAGRTGTAADCRGLAGLGACGRGDVDAVAESPAAESRSLGRSIRHLGMAGSRCTILRPAWRGSLRIQRASQAKMPRAGISVIDSTRRGPVAICIRGKEGACCDCAITNESPPIMTSWARSHPRGCPERSQRASYAADRGI